MGDERNSDTESTADAPAEASGAAQGPSAGSAEEPAADALPEDLKQIVRNVKAEATQAKQELADARQAEQEAKRETAAASENAVKIAKDAAETILNVAKQAEQAAKMAEQQAKTAEESAARGTIQFGKESDKENLYGFIYGAGLAIAFVTVVFWFFIFGAPTVIGKSNSAEGLTIIAHAVAGGSSSGDEVGSTGFKEQKWLVSGSVISRDKLEDRPKIVAVLTDKSGNSFSSTTTIADDEATFEVPIVQRFAEDQKRPAVSDIVVTASATKTGWFGGTEISASKTILPEIERSTRWSKASGKPFFASLLLLAMAFLLSLWHSSRPYILRATYCGTVILSLGFTASMIIFISTTSQQLAGSQRTDEVISLGFAYVYFGTYVKDTDPEWLLSLTTPTRIVRAAQTTQTKGESETRNAGKPAATPQGTGGESETPQAITSEAADTESKPANISRGFGAPLWVLLLSVVGSAIFLVKLIVDGLKSPTSFTPEIARERMAQIVRHQVYVLFSPLGSVFIYQLLIAAGSASETITVGIAALAAGLALNSLLERAWKSAESAITK